MSNKSIRARRRFLTLLTSAAGGVAAAAVATPFVLSFFPSERAKAAGALVEVDINKLEAGQRSTLNGAASRWVVNRTPEQVKKPGQASTASWSIRSRKPRSNPEYCKNAHRSTGRKFGCRWHLHPPGLFPNLPSLTWPWLTWARNGWAASTARAMVPSSTSPPAFTRGAGAEQYGNPRTNTCRTLACWLAMTNKRRAHKNEQATSCFDWIDARFPLTSTWKAHVSEYYAPKNFNFWYFFGSLAMLVLVIQIVTGIFLTMNYKPDGTLNASGVPVAFASVEYIMRDVAGG